MELAQTRPLALSRADVLLPALLAALSAVAVVALAPPGGDTAAHLYRTLLVREGVYVWDNLWFAGHYPLASYSFLYYLPAAVVGNVALVSAAVVASAALFASLAHTEWGDAATWPARVFAVLAAGPLFTGTYSYALGLAAALATLRLLQAGRTRVAIVTTALTLGFSPLAFAFLCVALAAVALARRRLDPALAVALGAVAALQLVALALFPSEGRYPFSRLSLAAVVAVCALGAVLAAGAPRGGRVLAAFFLVWGVVCVVAFVVPSPFGDNLTRLRAVVFPLVLVAALLARFRPRPVALAALAVALVYNLGPDVSVLPKRADDARTAEEAFWQPALAFLRAHPSPGHRVEVVPTFGHWEAWWVPRAGFPLARGWYRQLDLAENPVLYRETLSASEYRAWLRRAAVRYVLVPDARLGPFGARREARLVVSGAAGLVPVFRSADWRIYELRGAPQLLTGKAAAAVDHLGHERVSGRTSAAGRFRLRVRYTPYWRVTRGDACLAPASDGLTHLVARRAGRFELALGETPASLARSLAGQPAAAC